MKSDILIIGAGVAGLAAAAHLSRRGLKVSLLEARDRIGGRILSLRPSGWDRAVELGAEFIHRGNPELSRVLQQAGIKNIDCRSRCGGASRAGWNSGRISGP